MFTFQEALEAIKDKPEFKVMERDGFTVIDYVIQKEDTFKGKHKHILINLRGTAFDSETGEIISLPLHKFHNLNECEGYMESDINFDDITCVQVKEDGSMIRPIPMKDGTFRLGTRAGITDVSMQAEEFMVNSELYREYNLLIKDCINLGLTPIFEYVAPSNKIILDYKKPSLILLAIRINHSGIYLNLKTADYDVPLVSESSLKPHEVKNLEGTEGIVVTLKGGFKFKVKSDWYVRRHKAKDLVRFSKDVVKLILEDTLDDVLPLLSEKDKNQIRFYKEHIYDSIENCGYDISSKAMTLFNKFSEKKDYAQVVLNEDFCKTFSGEFFRLWDSRDTINSCDENARVLTECLLAERLLKNCSSSTKINKELENIGCMTWEEYREKFW